MQNRSSSNLKSSPAVLLCPKVPHQTLVLQNCWWDTCDQGEFDLNHSSLHGCTHQGLIQPDEHFQRPYEFTTVHLKPESNCWDSSETNKESGEKNNPCTVIPFLIVGWTVPMPVGTAGKAVLSDTTTALRAYGVSLRTQFKIQGCFHWTLRAVVFAACGSHSEALMTPICWTSLHCPLHISHCKQSHPQPGWGEVGRCGRRVSDSLCVQTARLEKRRCQTSSNSGS